MIAIWTRFRSTFGVVVLFLSFLGAVVAQVRFDKIQEDHYDLHAPVHRFVMPAPVVNHLAFGFKNVLADYYWITAVQDFLKWDRHDAYYPEYFRTIFTLDPYFEYPYVFAILTVPSRQNPESFEWLALVAERALQIFPENWEIPFYVGMQYHVAGNLNDEAVKYLEIAAAKKTSPDIVRTTLGVYLMRDKTDYERSRALFATIHETSTNDATRTLAKERIALLDLIETLERVARVYKVKYGVFPSSVGDIEEKRLIQLPPELKKFYIKIDPSTGKVFLAR